MKDLQKFHLRYFDQDVCTVRTYVCTVSAYTFVCCEIFFVRSIFLLKAVKKRGFLFVSLSCCFLCVLLIMSISKSRFCKFLHFFYFDFATFSNFALICFLCNAGHPFVSTRFEKNSCHCDRPNTAAHDLIDILLVSSA